VLANTRASADSESGRENRERQAESIRAGGLQNFLDEMLSKLLGESTVAAAPDVVRCVEDILKHATPEGTAGMLMAMAARMDSTETIRDTNLPVCVISGTEDILIPPAEAEAMHGQLRNSELTIIPNSGHLSCLERPVRFNAIVRAFIQSNVLT
jgi:pimeloyl-ACP methyl ester carboxylesterase